VKFILKEGLIHIVDNHGIPNNNIEAEVEAPDLKGYNLEYSLNNGAYISIEKNIVIPKELLQLTKFNLKIRAKKGSEFKYFKSDDIPLQHLIIFGGKLEDRYPEALKYLLKRMDYVEQVIGIKEKEIDENMKQTKEILQKDLLLLPKNEPILGTCSSGTSKGFGGFDSNFSSRSPLRWTFSFL
jgi:hypothetical protein